MRKRLTYKKKDLENAGRRNFIKYLLGTGVLVAGSSISFKYLPKIFENNLREKSALWKSKAYIKLIDLVESEKHDFPVKEQGWGYYAAQDLKEYPCLKEKTSHNQLTSFYKSFNDNKSGPTMGQAFKRPIWNCLEDKII